MTEKQRKYFYFPAWNRAFAANWTRVKGAAKAVEGRQDSDTLQEVICTARVLIGKATGPIAPDELRYACHALARRHTAAWKRGVDEAAIPLQCEPISSDGLDNFELEQCVWLFRLLEDPDDLDAGVHWVHPENDQRQRYLWYLDHKCLAGYVARVSADKYGTSDHHSLSTECLRELTMTLKNRRGAGRKGEGRGMRDEEAEGKAEAARQEPSPTTPEPVLEDCPF
jgi:hypothetical protein